jgi:nucleoside-diphosphate-sugar epimerase
MGDQIVRHLITGGTGFLGSALCNKLASLGDEVVAFDNFSRASHIKEKLHPNVKTFDGDIRSKNDISTSLYAYDFDTIWHLAYINGTERFYKEPDLVLDVAVRGALNTIDMAKAHNIQKYILVSTSEVYNEPKVIPTPETEPLIIPDVHNPRFSYSGGKIISELLTIHSGLNTVIFRPHNVYGANAGFEHVIPQLVKKMLDSKDGTITIQGDGSETRSFCYIDDAIDGMILGSQTKEKNAILNIGTQDEITILELANKISNILKLNMIIKTAPKQNGSPSRRCPDISKLKSLGYTPKVSLDDGLEQTVKWYKERLEK